MIYLFYGGGENRAREKAHGLLESLLLKRPDASLFKIDALTYDPQKFEEYIYGLTLFSERYIVYLNKISENAEATEYIEKNIKAITASKHIFIFVEGSLTKKEVSKFEKNAEKVLFFKEKKNSAQSITSKKEKFNIFSVSDALASGNAKTAWIEFAKAKYNGAAAEELYPMMFWQMKNILLAHVYDNAKSADMKPFVYNKSKSFDRNINEQRVSKMILGINEVLYASRIGVRDFDESLELFTCSIDK